MNKRSKGSHMIIKETSYNMLVADKRNVVIIVTSNAIYSPNEPKCLKQFQLYSIYKLCVSRRGCLCGLTLASSTTYIYSMTKAKLCVCAEKLIAQIPSLERYI